MIIAAKFLPLMLQQLRPHFLLSAVLLSGALALTAFAQGPPAGGAAPPRVALRKFAARGSDWAWIAQRGDRTELWTGAPGAAGRKVAEGADWTEVALGKDGFWLLERKGDQGRLLQVAPGGPSEVKVAAGPLQQPDGLYVDDQYVYWVEAGSPQDPGLAFIPTLGTSLSLLRRDAQGQVTTVATWPAGGRLRAGDVSILGTTGSQLCLSTFNGLNTEFLSIPLSGGSPLRIASEADQQDGAVFESRLVWTAPSDEATPASGIRSVRGLSAGGKVETLAEWVPRAGDLLSVKNQLLYAGGGRVYRIPGSPVPAEYSGAVTFGPVSTDGKFLVELAGESPISKEP